MNEEMTVDKFLEEAELHSLDREGRLEEVYCWIKNGWLETKYEEEPKRIDPVEHMEEVFSKEFIMEHIDEKGIGEVPEPKVMYQMGRYSDELDEFLSLVRKWSP